MSLTPTEYAILHLLMANPGKVFSTKVLYESVWQEAALGSEGAVAVHIRHLREKIEINPSEPRYLKVVWGQGYKMEGGKYLKYNIVFNSLPSLCAPDAFGSRRQRRRIIGMTEAGLYDISVEELRDRYIRSDGESMAGRIAGDYAEANLGGVPEAIAGPTVYDLGRRGRPAGFTACSTRRWRATC